MARSLMSRAANIELSDMTVMTEGYAHNDGKRPSICLDGGTRTNVNSSLSGNLSIIEQESKAAESSMNTGSLVLRHVTTVSSLSQKSGGPRIVNGGHATIIGSMSSPAIIAVSVSVAAIKNRWHTANDCCSGYH